MPHQPSKLKLTTTIRQVSPLHGRCRSAPMDQKYLPLQSDHVLNRKGTHTKSPEFQDSMLHLGLFFWFSGRTLLCRKCEIIGILLTVCSITFGFGLPQLIQSRRFILNYLNNLVLWQESGYQMGLLFSSRAKKYRKKSLKLPSPATLGSTAITDAGGTRRKALRRGDGAETASRGGHSVSSNRNWGTSWDATTSAWHGAKC